MIRVRPVVQREDRHAPALASKMRTLVNSTPPAIVRVAPVRAAASRIGMILRARPRIRILGRNPQRHFLQLDHRCRRHDAIDFFELRLEQFEPRRAVPLAFAGEQRFADVNAPASDFLRLTSAAIAASSRAFAFAPISAFAFKSRSGHAKGGAFDGSQPAKCPVSRVVGLV